jgi:hypothetical protein
MDEARIRKATFCGLVGVAEDLVVEAFEPPYTLPAAMWALEVICEVFACYAEALDDPELEVDLDDEIFDFEMTLAELYDRK